MRAIRILIVGLIITGCDQSISRMPTVPSMSPPAVPLFKAPAVPAALDIKNLSTTISIDRPFHHRIRFVLQETSGQSAARILSIELRLSDTDYDLVDHSCWGDDGLIVRPGTTVIVDGQSLGYCAPVVLSGQQARSVSLRVEFTDESGAVQTTHATAPVTR